MTYRFLLHRSDESFPVSRFWVSPDAQSGEGYSICTVNPGSGLSPRQMSNFLWGYSKVTNVGNILQSGCCEARHISLNLFTSLSVFSVGVLQKTKLFTPVLKILSVTLKSSRKPWKLNQIECRWKYRCFIYIYSKEYLCDYFVPDSTKTFAGGSTEIEANIFTFCLLLFKIPFDFLCNMYMTHEVSGPFTSAELLLLLHFHVHGQTLRFQSLLKWWALMLHMACIQSFTTYKTGSSYCCVLDPDLRAKWVPLQRRSYNYSPF